MLNPEIMNELKSIREQEQKVGRIKMLQKGYKTIYEALEMLLGMA